MTGLPFVVDDGGRIDAGFSGKTPGDCVTRAIAIATGLPYREVYDALAAGMAGKKGRRGGVSARTARDGVVKSVYKPYIEALGWVWTPTMTIGSGCQRHLRAGEIPMEGPVIVAVSKHMVAVVDGVIRDSHDPGRDGTRCVYGYWTPPPG